MFKQLVAIIWLVTMGTAWSQRILSTPDVSGFTMASERPIAVDAQGWLYAAGFSTRAMGLKRTGLARVTPGGVIDGQWNPAQLYRSYSHVVTSNGDSYVLGLETATGPRVIARYSPAGSSAPAAIYRTGAVAGDPNSGIGKIFGARGRYVYFTDSNRTVATTLRRIEVTTGQLDPNWAFFAEQLLMEVAQGDGDDVPLYVLEQQYPGLNRSSYVRRVSTGATANVLWGRTVPVEDVRIAAATGQGGVYVIARDTAPSTRTEIFRLNASGEVDASWNGNAAGAAASSSRWNRAVAVVGDRLLVSANSEAVMATQGQPGIRMYDRSGAEIASWSPATRGQVTAIVAGFDGRAYAAVDGTTYVLNGSTLHTERALPLSFGSLGVIASITALPDGGRLIVGTFDVWFGGVRYRNVLRVSAEGLPNPDWRIDLDDWWVAPPIVTARGVVWAGRFTRINGVDRAGLALVSLDNVATVVDWQPNVKVADYSLAYDGQNSLYFTTRASNLPAIGRLSMTSALVDADWKILIDAWREEENWSLGLDGGGGIWLIRDAMTYLMEASTRSLVQRFSVADRTETMRTTIMTSLLYPRTFMATAAHVYIAGRRYRISDGGQLDPAWRSERDETSAAVRTLAGGFLYYAYSAAQGTVIRRAALTGNGEPDPGWGVPVASLIDCVQPDVRWFTDFGQAMPVNAEFLIRCDDQGFTGSLVPGVIGDMKLATTANDPTTDVQVMEYFNRDASRYFVTGRRDEQTLLDARPTVFARTGMQFRAHDGRYLQSPEQPVCRFYASPERGGSNTHFYGTGEDCAVLNTATPLRFEGYDFSVLKPGTPGCPSASPYAVTRLFNNKVASNESNHRYVVSAATKAKMLAQGWVDEGVVFCTSSATDATN